MNQLTEYYKILQRFSSLYAGEGDDELTRHAADAITLSRKRQYQGAIYARTVLFVGLSSSMR